MNDLKEFFCMASADAPSSYAANSKIQRNAIARAKPLVKQSVKELCAAMLPGAKQLVVADLGCSYGPNVFTVMSDVLDAVGESCRELRRNPPPEVQFFLNDLPRNDFNDVFRSLASYEKQLREEKGEEMAGRLFVAGVPGSFYGRLFPCRSVHLFHSSSSIHWLSQVPEGLKDDKNNEVNKGNIHVGRTSPPCVHVAYREQFRRDFYEFLRCRSEEIQDGGFMVLTLVGRNSSDLFSALSVLMFEFITQILKSMAGEGLINEGNIDALNIPFYNPSIEELQSIINDQGSFQIVEQSMVEFSGDDFANSNGGGKISSSYVRGQITTRFVRAATEALFACHFGEENNVIDEMFTRLQSILTREYEKGEDFKSTFYILTLKRNSAL